MACGALGAGLALTGPEPTVRVKEEKLKIIKEYKIMESYQLRINILFSTFMMTEPPHEIINNVVCATSKASDQSLC